MFLFYLWMKGNDFLNVFYIYKRVYDVIVLLKIYKIGGLIIINVFQCFVEYYDLKVVLLNKIFG